MRNRDWLNSLSDEELARFFSIVADYGDAFFPNELFITYQTATKDMKYPYAQDFEEWLQAEREEN